MSIPYYRPVSAQFVKDDYFLKDMPESIIPPPKVHKEKPQNTQQDALSTPSDPNDPKVKELKHYRDMVKSMGRELSNLQTTVEKLKNENRSLRKGSASQARLTDIVLSDPSVEVDSQDEFIERYVALKARLDADMAEYKRYKDKVQRLQNQLIKAHDREKKLLSNSLIKGEVISKPVDKDIKKIRKLEKGVIQREKIIKDLENSLAECLERSDRGKSAQSIVSFSSRPSTEFQDDAGEISNLMNENARLREELEEYRFQTQQEDMRNTRLNANLAATENRLESLEAQLQQNARDWSSEKRDLTIRLQEHRSDFRRSGLRIGTDVRAGQSFN